MLQLLLFFTFSAFGATKSNLPIGHLEISQIKNSKPYVSKSHVKVWNAMLSKNIRINVIEFKGELPLHKHPDAGHNMLVHKGKVEVLIGDNKFKAQEGSFIFIPKNVPHKYWTVGKSATLISMDAPYYDRDKTINLE